MNFAATIKQVINKRWILKLLTLKPFVVVVATASEGMGGVAMAVNSATDVVVAVVVFNEGDTVTRDRLHDSSCCCSWRSSDESLPRFWMIGKSWAELQFDDDVGLQKEGSRDIFDDGLQAEEADGEVVVLVAAGIWEDREAVEKGGVDKEVQDAGEQGEGIGVVESVEFIGVLTRFNCNGCSSCIWCSCMPSSPPIRSKKTSTFSKTSLVNGIYWSTLVK